MNELDVTDFAFLELSETEDGEIVLRRTGAPADAYPLVSVRFSGEARLLLGERTQDIARAMVSAGVQLATYHMANPDAGDDEPRLLH